MKIRVESEVGRLRGVLVHRPGLEIDRMVPSMMEQLLFDDILYGEAARDEHDRFTAVLERCGVRVLGAEELLAEVLAGGDARRWLLDELQRSFAASQELVAELADLGATELAAALVGGLRAPAEAEDVLPRRLFALDPLPNYFFQRDPQVVLGDRVLISAMATGAREREPLLARALFRYHPELAAAGASLIDVEVPPSADPERDPRFAYRTLEGGDVLVPSPEVVLVGVSERTNRWGVEYLAEHLRGGDSPFRHLIVVELPHRRSYMHLDTVFTFIDRGAGLGYLPVVEPGTPESAHVYQVDLGEREVAFRLRPSLRHAMAGVGLPVDEVVPCGGAADVLDQEREQWTDGANAFAVAPGVIVLYRRNRRTLDELSDRGWRVVGDREVLSGGADPMAGGRTVIALDGDELSRARGGPRCMTMPLVREP